MIVKSKKQVDRELDFCCFCYYYFLVRPGVRYYYYRAFPLIFSVHSTSATLLLQSLVGRDLPLRPRGVCCCYIRDGPRDACARAYAHHTTAIYAIFHQISLLYSRTSLFQFDGLIRNALKPSFCSILFAVLQKLCFLSVCALLQSTYLRQRCAHFYIVIESNKKQTKICIIKVSLSIDICLKSISKCDIWTDIDRYLSQVSIPFPDLLLNYYFFDKLINDAKLISFR